MKINTNPKPTLNSHSQPIFTPSSLNLNILAPEYLSLLNLRLPTLHLVSILSSTESSTTYTTQIATLYIRLLYNANKVFGDSLLGCHVLPPKNCKICSLDDQLYGIAIVEPADIEVQELEVSFSLDEITSLDEVLLRFKTKTTQNGVTAFHFEDIRKNEVRIGIDSLRPDCFLNFEEGEICTFRRLSKAKTNSSDLIEYLISSGSYARKAPQYSNLFSYKTWHKDSSSEIPTKLTSATLQSLIEELNQQNSDRGKFSLLESKYIAEVSCYLNPELGLLSDKTGSLKVGVANFFEAPIPSTPVKRTWKLEIINTRNMTDFKGGFNVKITVIGSN